MNAQEFAAYADDGYNRIPVVHDIIADLETPLSVYLKLANGPFRYLLYKDVNRHMKLPTFSR